MFRVLCLIISALVVVSITTDKAFGEQIVIDENSEGKAVAGDFYCSPCYNPILDDSEAVDVAAKTLTAGELYKYFQSRGIKKLSRLSFQVDVDCDPDNTESVSLTDLSFQIEDSALNLVTHAGFGDTELLLDKSEITSFKPEAVLEIDLGYDFMQRFSPESKESVSLNFSSPDTSSGMMPRIFLASDMSSFSSSNLVRIGGFIAFWGIIFFGAHVMSRKPKDAAQADGNQVTLTANASAVGNVAANSGRHA